MSDFQPRTRRRLWPLFVPFALLVALAVIWVGFWFYAASAAEGAMARWREREANSGRNYACGSESLGGFPFRIEVHCAKPVAELRGQNMQLVLTGVDLKVLAQIYQPTLLISEFAGPMTIAEAGQPTAFVANWTLGQASVRGTPRAPERASLVFDGLTINRPDSDKPVLGGKRIELHGRVADGSRTDNLILDLALQATSLIVPELHDIASTPMDADISATLHGLVDLRPKPWSDRFREMQAHGGRIEIANARLQQGEIIAVSNGTLRLTENGNLDGQLQMTVVGIERAIKLLDLEAIVSKGRIGSAIDSLDRIIPGLGNIARKNAAPGLLAGLDAIGKRTVLEGKPALAVPLRFVDGRIMLGPLAVGRAPPLF